MRPEGKHNEQTFRRLRVARNAQPETSRLIHEVQDDTAHLWAVSYADFLMVLLSFFILFFSVDKVTKQTIIQKISLITTGQAELSGKAGGAGDGTGTGTGVGAGTGTGNGTGPGNGTVVTLTEQGASVQSVQVLKGILSSHYGLKVESEEERLVLQLPDRFFGPGQLKPQGKALAQLKDVLKKIQPYQNEIQITFVGHTDPSPVRKMKGRYVADNFDVSAQRAAKALQIAVRQGFFPRNLTAKGAAEHDRQSRTLSLVISPREPTRGAQ